MAAPTLPPGELCKRSLARPEPSRNNKSRPTGVRAGCRIGRLSSADVRRSRIMSDAKADLDQGSPGHPRRWRRARDRGERWPIVELVPAGGKPATADVAVFDAGDHVVLPGLINTHHHFYQTLTRALPAAMDRELFPWLQALYPVWAKLTPERSSSASPWRCPSSCSRAVPPRRIITTCSRQASRTPSISRSQSQSGSVCVCC